MTKAQFIKNNRGIDGGLDLDANFLCGIYDRTVSKRMLPPGQCLGRSSADLKSAGSNFFVGSKRGLGSFRQRRRTALQASAKNAAWGVLDRGDTVRRKSLVQHVESSTAHHGEAGSAGLFHSLNSFLEGSSQPLDSRSAIQRTQSAILTVAVAPLGDADRGTSGTLSRQLEGEASRPRALWGPDSPLAFSLKLDGVPSAGRRRASSSTKKRYLLWRGLARVTSGSKTLFQEADERPTAGENKHFTETEPLRSNMAQSALSAETEFRYPKFCDMRDV